MNMANHEENNILWQFWVKETPFLKKKVSVWHTMELTSWLRLQKNFGSLHIMIFRYCGNILVSMQSYFWNVKGVKKFMFGCHTLTHGTKLRRLPQDVFLLMLRASVWVFPYYYQKWFFLILEIHVLPHQDLKDPNSHVSPP